MPSRMVGVPLTCTRSMSVQPSASTAPICRTVPYSRPVVISSRSVTSGASATSALELQNAETKRVAKSGGSCRQQMSAAGGDPPKWPQRHCSRGRHCDTWVCNHAIHLHAAQALGCPDAAPRRRGHCPAGEPPEGAAAQRVGRTKLPLEMGQGGGAEP